MPGSPKLLLPRHLSFQPPQERSVQIFPGGNQVPEHLTFKCRNGVVGERRDEGGHGVGEGVAAPRSPDSNLGREGETDRQSGAEGEGRREVYGEREGEGGRERASGQENFPDDFSLRLVPIFFVMWRAKNEQRRKGIGRGELEGGGKSVGRAWARRRRSCTRSRSHTRGHS